MARFELQFRVDAPRDDPDGTSAVFSKQSQSLRDRIYKTLQLKPHSVAWVTIRLGTAKADRAFQVLLDERRSGRAIVGSATLMEFLDEDEIKLCDWHILNTRQVDDFSLWDDYPSCKAGTLPKVHAPNHSFVSEALASACERAGLTGIEFLRCQNRGRKHGPPWFAALPNEGLGNGVDHPWFDRPRWARHVEADSHKRVSAVGDGQNSFH